MNTKDDIDKLEKLIGQLQGLHDEISLLAKKTPNDAVNPFKLKLINKVLVIGNEVLEAKRRPFEDFEQFDLDDVPSNSDVMVILTQYINAVEQFREIHIVIHRGQWVYVIDNKPTNRRAYGRKKR